MKAKQRKRENIIEAVFCPIITDLVSEDGKDIPASQILGTIIGNIGIDGYYDEKRPNEFQTGDFGTIYRNTITNIICDKNIDAEGSFICPHCSNFETKIESEYQRHVVIKHPRKHGYPQQDRSTTGESLKV